LVESGTHFLDAVVAVVSVVYVVDVSTQISVALKE
jgi:hypothetical protein